MATSFRTPAKYMMPVLPPEDYMSAPGQTSMNWTRWLVVFQRYLFMKEMERKEKMGEAYSELSNEEKNTTVFMGLGKEAQRQFMSLPRGKEFNRGHTEFFKDASNLFQKKDKLHTLVARHMFLERNQTSSESISEML